MKKYLCFVTSAEHLPGGWDDFIGSFDTLEELTKEASKQVKLMNGYANNVQIVDRGSLRRLRNMEQGINDICFNHTKGETP